MWQHGHMDITTKYRIDPASGCWHWNGATSLGYGVIEVPGYRAIGQRRILMAHRVMWEMLHGFTDAEHVHHICENKRCVNPAHLQPMSHRDNNRLAYSTFRDGTCRRGHTDLRTKPSGGHYCRTCNTERMRRARQTVGGDRND